LKRIRDRVNVTEQKVAAIESELYYIESGWHRCRIRKIEADQIDYMTAFNKEHKELVQHVKELEQRIWFLEQKHEVTNRRLYELLALGQKDDH